MVRDLKIIRKPDFKSSGDIIVESKVGDWLDLIYT